MGFKTTTAKEMPNNVGSLFPDKILQLPPGCQYSMKLLAYVVSKCNESFLRLEMEKGKD